MRTGVIAREETKFNAVLILMGGRRFSLNGSRCSLATKSIKDRRCHPKPQESASDQATYDHHRDGVQNLLPRLICG